MEVLYFLVSLSHFQIIHLNLSSAPHPKPIYTYPALINPILKPFWKRSIRVNAFQSHLAVICCIDSVKSKWYLLMGKTKALSHGLIYATQTLPATEVPDYGFSILWNSFFLLLFLNPGGWSQNVCTTTRVPVSVSIKLPHPGRENCPSYAGTNPKSFILLKNNGVFPP